MAANPNSATAPKIPPSLLADLETPLLEITSLQRIVEIVLEQVFDCKHPGLPQEEGCISLLVSKGDVDALQHAVFAASDATAKARKTYYAALEQSRSAGANP